MSYDEAVRWALQSARMLAAMPPPTGREADDRGLSVSTWGPLTKYAMLSPGSTVSTHAAAINHLALHSRTQLNRSDYEAARDAILAEYKRYRPESEFDQEKIYHKDQALVTFHDESELFDSNPKYGAKRIKVKPGVWVLLSYDKRHVANGINRDRVTVGYDAAQRYWRVLHAPADWDVLAGNLERAGERDAANYIRNNRDIWAAQMPAAPTPPKRPATGDARQGGVDTFNWTWDKDNFRILISAPSSGEQIQLTADAKGAAENRQTAQGWRVSVPVANLEMFANNIAASRPELAEAIRSHLGEWTADKAALRQTKERGVAEGGFWRYKVDGVPSLAFSQTDKAARGALAWGAGVGKVSGGIVTVLYSDLPRAIEAIKAQGNLPDLVKQLEERARAWRSDFKVGRGERNGVKWSLSIPGGTLRVYIPNAKGAAETVGVTADRDGEGWHIAVREKGIPKVVDYLASKYPRLAEAINRAFGGAHAIMDEEVERCRKLAALSGVEKNGGIRSGAVEFNEVTDPEARKAVDEVAEALAGAFPKGRQPFPYQVIGATFARMSGYRCLIADEPGLGKTIQAIACLALDGPTLLPALIIAPASVCGAWAQAVADWLPSVPVAWLDKTSTPMPREGWRGVVIASWDAMRTRRVEFLKYGFQFFIADESHKGKDMKSSQTKAARLLALPVDEKTLEEVPDAKTIPHVLFLSGTPLKNSVLELWPQLSAIDAEGWGKLSKFKAQYDVLTARSNLSKEIPGFDRMSEEQQQEAVYRLTQRKIESMDGLRDRLHCTMIRRLKQDLKFLPPKYRTTVNAPLAGDMRIEYGRASAQFKAWLQNAVRKKLLDLGFDEHTANEDAHAAVARALRAETLVQIGQLREIAGRGKIGAAIRLGKQLSAAGEPFLYFCDHVEVVDALEAALSAAGIRYGVIDGSVTGPKRYKVVDAFQKDKTIDAIICTTAAKEGLTLTRAAVTIFVEHFWTAADEQQAEDRIHRISQTRPATIAYLHAPATIDDFMASLVSGKRNLTRAIMGAEDVSEDDAAVEAAKSDAVLDFVTRLSASDDAVYDAQYAAAPAPLRAWMEAHEGEVRDAIREVIYPHGPPLESEEKVLREILTRLAPYRRNPRPRR